MSGTTTADALGGLSRIYDGVLSIAADVPFPLLEMSVFDTIEEFCRRSCIWRQTLQWTMAPGVSIYDLNPIDDAARVVWIWRVTGLRLFRLSPPSLIIDYGTTTKTRSGTVLAVIKPARLNEYGMPSFIVDEWSEALRDGTLMRLFLMPNKPWSNIKLAQYHGQRFRSAMFMAKDTVRRQGDILQPGFPYFAHGAQRSSGIFVGAGDGTSDQSLANSPIPINDGEADVDDGLFSDPPAFGDLDGGTF